MRFASNEFEKNYFKNHPGANEFTNGDWAVMCYLRWYERCAPNLVIEWGTPTRARCGVTKTCLLSVQGWGLLVQFPNSIISPIFRHFQNRHYLFNMTFIFGRCCNSAAVTPAKYEYHSRNLTGIFASSKILLTKKLTNGALVTPTPGRQDSRRQDLEP